MPRTVIIILSFAIFILSSFNAFTDSSIYTIIIGLHMYHGYVFLYTFNVYAAGFPLTPKRQFLRPNKNVTIAVIVGVIAVKIELHVYVQNSRSGCTCKHTSSILCCINCEWTVFHYRVQKENIYLDIEFWTQLILYIYIYIYIYIYMYVY